jgi:hypothetical protein
VLKVKTEISYFGMRLLRHTKLRYRNRHAFYKTNTNLQAAHAAFPWIVTWDDHEVENNYANNIFNLLTQIRRSCLDILTGDLIVYAVTHPTRLAIALRGERAQYSSIIAFLNL